MIDSRRDWVGWLLTASPLELRRFHREAEEIVADESFYWAVRQYARMAMVEIDAELDMRSGKLL